jgi:hypothetical protein
VGRSESTPEHNKADSLKWNEFRKIQAAKRHAVEGEVDKAVEIAEAIAPPIDPSEESRIVRRRSTHHTWKREPINGFTERQSDIARHVQGFKLAGCAATEAFEKTAREFDVKPRYISNLYYEKRELFDLAESEVMESAMKEYHQNLWICRTALSQAGPMAVQTFIDAMQSEDASWNVKTKAAHAVLKLIDVDGSNNANPSEKIALESLKLVKAATVDRDNGGESHVIEAEDAVIIEDNASVD